MSIYHDLEAIKAVALDYTKKDGYNYNIILHNPNAKGEFDLETGSTYEFVMDSYFNTPRPNVILICKTKDLLQAEDTQRLINSFSPDAPYMKMRKEIEIKGLEMEIEINSTSKENGKLKRGLSMVEVKADGVNYKNGGGGLERISNTGRNDKCNCGSGKKFKKCCGK
jgi:hypothetical protein